jgi:hypothetical protein
VHFYFEVFAHRQGHKTDEHMSPDGILRAMKDRSGLQIGFAHAKRLLHVPEIMIVVDNGTTRQLLLRDVGDITFDAKKLLCLCLKICNENKRLVGVLGFLGKLCRRPDSFFSSRASASLTCLSNSRLSFLYRDSENSQIMVAFLTADL